MAPADDGPPADPRAPLDRLRHDLLTPLTVIRGRAYLLGRAVRRSPTLADGERGRLLAELAAIDAAVAALVAVVDEAGSDDAPRAGDAAGHPGRRGADEPRCGAG
jgi:hypothetical protein